MARAIDDPYNLALALAYGGITHHLRGDLPAMRDVVAELTELCQRYDFAYYREWGLILDGWSRPDASGLDLARQGISNLREAGSFARMPYWLALLADLCARDGQAGAARATLDAALAAGQAHDDRWWLPEVMRARAAYDDEQPAIARLRAAAVAGRGPGQHRAAAEVRARPHRVRSSPRGRAFFLEPDLGERGGNDPRTAECLASWWP